MVTLMSILLACLTNGLKLIFCFPSSSLDRIAKVQGESAGVYLFSVYRCRNIVSVTPQSINLYNIYNINLPDKVKVFSD